jgi:hypothetical protein
MMDIPTPLVNYHLIPYVMQKRKPKALADPEDISNPIA